MLVSAKLSTMMKRLVCLLLVTCSAWVSAEHSRPYMEVIAVDYPPFTGPQLAGFGSNFRLLDAYAKQHFKVEPKPAFYPPARAQVLIEKTAWCLSFYPPEADNTKARFVALTEQKVALGLYRLRQDDDVFRWDSLADLAGKRVALMRAKKPSPLQQAFTQAGLKIEHVDGVEQGLQMLLRGRVDYAFGDSTSAALPDLSEQQRQRLQFSDTSFFEAQIGIFYNQDCREQLFITPPKQ